MSNLSVDTVELYESGQNIVALTKEMNEELNALFTRISNIGTRTLEWVGPASEQFIRRMNIEKIQYLKVVNALNNYGQVLMDASASYETVVKKRGNV